MITRLLKDAAVRLGVFPHIFFSMNPFKIFEFREVMKELRLSGNETVLDLGCGNGLQAMLIARKCGRVVGIDTSKEAVEGATRRTKHVSKVLKKTINAEFLCTTIQGANFPDGCFDSIGSFCVLEHMPDYVGVLTECMRVLKKGGQLVFSVDALENIDDAASVEKHKKEHHVVTYFKRDELRGVLEGLGFRDIEIKPILKCDYSKELFINGIDKNFKYDFLYSILNYYRISQMEASCRQNGKGIFLVVNCIK